jgi:hypothetical protein
VFITFTDKNKTEVDVDNSYIKILKTKDDVKEFINKYAVVANKSAREVVKELFNEKTYEDAKKIIL